MTRHAITRYQERARPDLTFEEARAELVSMVGTAPAIEPPSWAGMPRLCLQLAPGVVGCCEYAPGRRSRYSLKTVLTAPEQEAA